MDLTCFFLFDNFCLLTLKLEASEIDCLDGAQIPAIYFVLQCANIRHPVSAAVAEVPTGCSDPPRARADAGGLSRWHQAFSTDAAASPHCTGHVIKRPGMLKITVTTIPTLEAFRTALQRSN